MMSCRSVGAVGAVPLVGQESVEIGAVREELRGFEARLEETPQDLAGIFHRLKELSEEIERLKCHAYGELEQRSVHECRAKIQSLFAKMDTEPVKTLAKEQDQWVKAGFDRALLKTDPEAVHFAVSTKLIYTIAMYEQSAGMLEGEPLTIRNVGGIAHFKVEGEWRPYAAFKERIQYSPEFEKFPDWNFIHPHGFVNRDRATYDRVYPIAQLNRAGYEAVAAHAQKFWGDQQPEIDVGVAKPCILQVMTTGKNRLPETWWAKNFREHFPEHAGARVITSNGEVYSFGTEMPRPEEKFLSCPEHYMGTGLTNVPVPDYEETRASDDRTMVALPISLQRSEAILDFVSRANKGIPFNFARQNCVRFTEVALHLAGVKVSTRMPHAEVFAGILPRASDIPYLGRVIAVVSEVTSKIFACIGTVVDVITPYPLKRVWVAVEDLVANAGARLGAIALNGLVLMFLGAGISRLPEQRPDAQAVPEVEHFERVITWRDLCTPEAIPVYYSGQLKKWMLAQSNVVVFQKPQNGFCCLT